MLLAAAIPVMAANTTDLLDTPVDERLFGKKAIQLGTSAVLPLPFDRVAKTMEKPGLLETICREYVQSKQGADLAEIPLVETSPGHYAFFNEKGQRTDITELYRKQTDAQSFDYILLTSGKRFFGHYDAIIHIRIVDVGEVGAVYTANIHAYPHNAATRFFTKRLRVARQYFKTRIRIISRAGQTALVARCEKEPLEPKRKDNAPALLQ